MVEEDFARCSFYNYNIKKGRRKRLPYGLGLSSPVAMFTRASGLKEACNSTATTTDGASFFVAVFVRVARMLFEGLFGGENLTTVWATPGHSSSPPLLECLKRF